MAALQLKTKVTSIFKMHGFHLRSDASKYLVDILLPVSERDEWIDRVLDQLQKQGLPSSTISKEQLQSAVQECSKDEEEMDEHIFNVIDAFNIPKLSYNPERKKFVPRDVTKLPPPCLFPDAGAKADLYRDRYTVFHQRTSRHSLFARTLHGLGGEAVQKYQLRPVEYLLGTTTHIGKVISLGMITQLKEGKYYLEDPTGSVLLDLSQTVFQSGLFTENCFVLAEGLYEDGVFHVSAMGFPPPEPADTTRGYFGDINFFGGPSTVSLKSSSRLQNIEMSNQDAMLVFLTDVWLDKVKVMNKLQLLFAGYSEMPPTCFVFLGNFLSTTYGNKHAKILATHLKMLAEMINEFPSLVRDSKFVFVPGPSDPGLVSILPRPPLLPSITEDFMKKLPSAIFTTNPCRIQYCTKEIVVFREDIVTKMCRNCIYFPKSGDISTHFTNTLVSQSHLSLLPLHVSPVYWQFDDALRLYPLPDLVVIGDKFDPFTENLHGCTVVNTGSFLKSDFSFKVYLPSSNQIEDSQIRDDST